MTTLKDALILGFDSARSATAWTLCAMNTTAFGLGAIGVSFFEDDGTRAYLFGKGWSMFNLRMIGSPVTTTGTDKIDPTQPYVVMANHRSHIDVWSTFTALPIQLRWVMKQELRKIPVFGAACERMGQVYVQRGNTEQARASMDLAAKKIADGASVVFFPEGTRSPDGATMGDFKKGGFRLAIAAQVPILPVCISGTEKILPSHTWRYAPGEVHVSVADPIPTEGMDLDDMEELMDRTKRAIADGLA